jgi:glycosyltransferase involved in cell wall biosynthesis
VLEHAAKPGGGLIVHSRHVAERAAAAGYSGPLWLIPHPAWRVPPLKPAHVPGTPLVGCFGNLNASKRLPQLLEAFAQIRRAQADATLLLVGATSARFDLESVLERHPSDGVVREDYVDDEPRLWSLMAACDVCVSLRAPTMGETSGSAIRALALGKPLVVSDVGWFAELPDSVALKVPVDAHEVDTLAAALELLVDESARAAMGAAARELVAREHDLDRVAELYVAALEEAAGGEAVRDAVLGEVAQAAADVGIGPESAEAGELARKMREAGIA